MPILFKHPKEEASLNNAKDTAAGRGFFIDRKYDFIATNVDRNSAASDVRGSMVVGSGSLTCRRHGHRDNRSCSESVECERVITTSVGNVRCTAPEDGGSHTQSNG